MVTRHRRVVHQWTRVTEMLCPNRGSSLTSTSRGKDWRLSWAKSAIVDDEKKASASASIALNRIIFQRPQRISVPPIDLRLFGRGLVALAPAHSMQSIH
jgi:hypothetical protein